MGASAGKKKILLVVGARPNFMKVAPVLEALKTHAADRFEPVLIHTGQHYDKNMSDVFFTELEMPMPDVFLGVGSGTHAEQTGKVMIEMESLVDRQRPDLVLVAGDVNSTLATALVAAKAGVPLGHIESGLRSFDRGMPEEINRIVADEFSDFCFVTEPSGLQNLRVEGIKENRVFYVGNTMIDSLKRFLPLARTRWEGLAATYGLEENRFALITLHRPSNVDERASLASLIGLFEQMATFMPRIVFPVHPRTRKRLGEFGLAERIQRLNEIVLTDPLGYLDFLAMQQACAVILTDSGGIQEEATSLHKPCITLRENTERPITVEVGTNELVGNSREEALRLSSIALEGKWKSAKIPELWDGHAGDRIAKVLLNSL